MLDFTPTADHNTVFISETTETRQSDRILLATSSRSSTIHSQAKSSKLDFVTYSIHTLSSDDYSVLPESQREVRYELASRKISGDKLHAWEEIFLEFLNKRLSEEFEQSASIHLKESMDFLENLKAVYPKF